MKIPKEKSPMAIIAEREGVTGMVFVVDNQLHCRAYNYLDDLSTTYDEMGERQALTAVTLFRAGEAPR